MDSLSFNARYSFNLGGVRFKIDIDNSISAKGGNPDGENDFFKLPHYHPMHELFFVFDDALTLNLGEEEIEFKNEIVCIPPFLEHRSTRGDDFRILFSVDSAECRDGALADFFSNITTLGGISSFKLGDEKIRQYLEELCVLTQKGGGEVEYELSLSLLRLIFYSVFKSGGSATGEDKKGKNESYYLIIDRIINTAATPGSEVSLKEISDALHLGKKQTARIIAKYYKKPLSALILEKKLDYSRYLLTSTSLKISEIAERANFISENYFYIKFKQAFGTTPLRYRKSTAQK